MSCAGRTSRTYAATIACLVSDGHTVYDDAGGNTSLAGKTYARTGGGTVKPA